MRDTFLVTLLALDFFFKGSLDLELSRKGSSVSSQKALECHCVSLIFVFGIYD